MPAATDPNAAADVLGLAAGHPPGDRSAAVSAALESAEPAAPAAGIAVLGDGARALPGDTLSRLVEAQEGLREVLDPRRRLSHWQLHAHADQRSEITSNSYVVDAQRARVFLKVSSRLYVA